MSLDYAFYRQDETETLWFHSHWDFLDMFTAEPRPKPNERTVQ